VPFDAVKFPGLPGAELPQYVTAYGKLESWIDAAWADGPTYASLVSQVDEDGNEVAGIRLPPITVPLGTHTGWNVYPADFAAGELCDRDGSFIAFAATEAEREAAGDARPSLEARYPTRDDYVAKVSAAASALVQQRLLLPEDAARSVDAATLEPALP
jgi:hypothetical protein